MTITATDGADGELDPAGVFDAAFGDLPVEKDEAGGFRIVLTNDLAAMSCGTADQMYLALRLAMCRKLLPEDAPLILDDALVNFDAHRAAAALRVLRAEAEKRQVILFTCRRFEEDI